MLSLFQVVTNNLIKTNPLINLLYLVGIIRSKLSHLEWWDFGLLTQFG